MEGNWITALGVAATSVHITGDKIDTVSQNVYDTVALTILSWKGFAIVFYLYNSACLFFNFWWYFAVKHRRLIPFATSDLIGSLVVAVQTVGQLTAKMVVLAANHSTAIVLANTTCTARIVKVSSSIVKLLEI